MLRLLTPFRVVGFLEGLSYLLLLFIATPIKYFFEDPKYVKWLGMPHGLLFIAYVLLAVLISKTMHWSYKTLWVVLLAAIIPFGTFYIDYKLLNRTHA